MQPTILCLESRGCLGIFLPTYGLYRIGTEPAKPLKRPELNPALLALLLLHSGIAMTATFTWV